MTHESILGAVLKQHRESQGIDQSEMCQRVGVTQPYWSKVELGRANPSTGIIRKACDALGMTEAELHSRIQKVRQVAEARGVKVVNAEEVVAVEEQSSLDDWMPLVAGVAIIALIVLVLGKRK